MRKTREVSSPRPCSSRDGSGTPVGLPPRRPALLRVGMLFFMGEGQGHEALGWQWRPSSPSFSSAWWPRCFFVKCSPSLLLEALSPWLFSLPTQGQLQETEKGSCIYLAKPLTWMGWKVQGDVWDSRGNLTCRIPFRKRHFRVRGGHLVHPSATELVAAGQGVGAGDSNSFRQIKTCTTVRSRG